MRKFLTFLAAMAIAVGFTTPAYAEENTSVEAGAEVVNALDPTAFGDPVLGAKLIKYMRVSSDKIPYFDYNAALKDGADDQVLRIGGLVNEYSAAYYFPEDRAGLKVWGNWCGPGHSGPGAPIDRLDAACMRHDKCYGRKGYFNCNCDRTLIDEIRRDYPRMGKKEKEAANAVLLFFTVQVLENPFCLFN